MCLLMEVRYPLATISNGKDTTFAGCARTHDLGIVPPNKKSGQRLRSTPRRRWAPRGCGEPVGQPVVPRRDPLRVPGEVGGCRGRYACSESYLTHVSSQEPY